MLSRLGRLVSNHPRLVIAAVLLVTAGLVPFTLGLRTEADVTKMLPEDDPGLKVAAIVDSEFGGSDQVVILVESPDVFAPAVMKASDTLIQQLQQLPGVNDVQSLTTLEDVRGGGDDVVISRLIDSVPTDSVRLAALRQRVLADERYRGVLVSADGSSMLILARLSPTSNKEAVVRDIEKLVEALEQAQAQQPDLIVLDVVMPKMDGFETLKQLRTFSAVPVIFLSAKGTDVDRIKGLGLGADDYLSKPFSPDELVARIDAVRRRVGPSESRKAHDRYVSGDLKIDFGKRLVTVNGQEARLTRIEWLLLSELAQNAGRLMLYEELLTRVWGMEYRDDVQLLRTWISRLRYKVEKDPGNPSVIRTMPKTGYIMDEPSE